MYNCHTLVLINEVLSACVFNISVASASAQQTKSFTISGKIKQESIITADSLKQYTVKAIKEFTITNYAGAFKNTDESLPGVLLKDILSHTVFNVSGPMLLSELYFVCTASDGYKVVYSLE